jgi:hypothetical protein
VSHVMVRYPAAGDLVVRPLRAKHVKESHSPEPSRPRQAPEEVRLVASVGPAAPRPAAVGAGDYRTRAMVSVVCRVSGTSASEPR